MNMLFTFMILIVIQSCYGYVSNSGNSTEKNSQKKPSREVEPFTSILLDDEAFSIAKEVKPPVDQSNAKPSRKKEKLKNTSRKSNHSETNQERGGINSSTIRPDHFSSASKGAREGQKGNFSLRQHKKKKSHHKPLMRARKMSKKVQKRHFEEQKGVYSKGSDIRRSNKVDNILGPTFRFVLTEASATKSNPQDNRIAYITFSEKFSTRNSNEFRHDSKGDNADYSTNRHSSNENFTPDLLSSEPTHSTLYPPVSSNYKRDSFSDPFQVNQIANEAPLSPKLALRSYENNRTGEETMALTVMDITTVPPVHTMTVRQVDIVQRNLPAPSKRSKQRAPIDDLADDESEFDDTAISFASNCDHILHNQTCWTQREVGDVLTLAVKITSSKRPASFQVRWLKVYHSFESPRGKPIEIEPSKLPWNMVSGSEGKELRLNPVDNTDIDPNCFVAKIFLLTKNRGKMLFKELKRLFFRIDIPIIDMGKIYAGEEVSINLENFISLPERGNLFLHWRLETKPHLFQSLPSNIKVSGSGRSLILKELKKGRLGVLNCIVYSTNRYAVAKRRFNILKIAESMKRRSAANSLQDDALSRDLLRSRRCRHIIRRSKEKARQRLEEGRRPKSRKKRFRRMESHSDRISKIDCEPLRKKAYSRWVRSLFNELTTEDPKLMPLEKLFELSEEGDGTLDDLIPREVHYVNPKVRLLSGTSAESSVHRPMNCTSHPDCHKNAICVKEEKTPEDSTANEEGICYCLPEYYGDGFTCRKIPASSHREKRLKRSSRNNFAVPHHLFYDNSPESERTSSGSAAEDEFTEPPKILAFDEEESFLLSDCIDDKDCSIHASCIQAANGHPYCRCRPGYRGSGIFCSEIMDYVPPEEHFVEDYESIGQTSRPDLHADRVRPKTAVPEEFEEM